MTAIVYQRSFFADLNGKPLDSGSLYIGAADQDPQTNPIQCYWDSALTIPATQPLAITSGYVTNGGVRAPVYVAATSYSLRARNKAGVQVDYLPNTAEGGFASAVTPGASLVGMKGDGVGSTPSNVAAYLWHHSIHLTDYYTGTLTTGSDITTALQKAVDAAYTRRQALGGVGRVYIPAGYYYQLSATITVPSFVEIHGAGKVETYLRRTGNYGNTFVFGTASPAANVQCAGISNLSIFHDHGNGTTPSTNPASWTNAVTGTPSHIVAYTPVACLFENLTLYCLPFQFVCQGGSFSTFRNIDTYGVWDDANANMQEGLAGFLMAGDTTVTGAIPTWHHIDFCRFGGMTRAGTSVTYHGGNTKTTVKNIGPQNGLVIWKAEALYITNSYTGACNYSGILISSKSTDIIAGVHISNHFFDPCGVKYQDACLKFENRDATGVIDGVTLTGCQFKGQQNGWRAISDWGSTATYGSVKDLIVTGSHASVFVGNPVELYNVRRASVDMNIAAYNCENYYSAGTTEACGIHVASGSVGVNISGSLGGGIYGETAFGANNRCQDGVRADDWVNSRVTVTAVDAGLNGKLFVGPPSAVQIVNSDADFTLTSGGASSQIIHTGTLTAGRTVTLSTTNAKDGDEFTISRTGGGAFNLTAGGKAIATNQWAQFKYDKPNTTWRLVGSGAL